MWATYVLSYRVVVTNGEQTYRYRSHVCERVHFGPVWAKNAIYVDHGELFEVRMVSGLSVLDMRPDTDESDIVLSEAPVIDMIFTADEEDDNRRLDEFETLIQRSPVLGMVIRPLHDYLATEGDLSESIIIRIMTINT